MLFVYPYLPALFIVQFPLACQVYLFHSNRLLTFRNTHLSILYIFRCILTIKSRKKTYFFLAENIILFPFLPVVYTYHLPILSNKTLSSPIYNQCPPCYIQYLFPCQYSYLHIRHPQNLHHVKTTVLQNPDRL